MVVLRLTAPNDFAEWRGKARQALAANLSPQQVEWRMLGEGTSLFETEAELPPAERPVGSVPKQFLDLAAQAICHTDPARFSVLYELLWQLQLDSTIMGNATLTANNALAKWASAVRRDSHKMKAFVRFKSIEGEGARERYAAWFEPEHYTLEMTAPFFARRFAGMDWGIVTPYRSARWDGEKLSLGPGGKRSDVPADDAVEDAWKTYFANIFNPARLKVAMMKSEMPVKYWKNLPEAELIAPLIRNARQSAAEMIERAASQPPSRHLRVQAQMAETQAPPLEVTSLETARQAVQSCRDCGLCEHATQAVFGEGPAMADVMFIGEQPGDSEDLAGRPFVGPAGQVLDQAIEKVGIDRSKTYVTNAVKHFKFVPRGKRRIHQRPDAGEIQACKFWLDLELGFVQPKVIVALGATAAQSLLGKPVTISKERGAPRLMPNGTLLFITNHPSYLLRLPNPIDQARERDKFEADLVQIRDAIAAL
jgi:probable DNA metabolism protein